MKKTTVVSIMAALMAAACFTGCLTRASADAEKTVYPDGRVTYRSRTSIIGTGDKASDVAGKGMFADGNEDELGAGFKEAAASQQSTGIGETLTGMGSLMSGMAQFMMTAQGMKVPKAVAVTEGDADAPEVIAPSVSVPLVSEASVAAASNLAVKMAEAKKSGKPLVVIAGSPGCNFCTTFDKVLNNDASFSARSDIVVYREMSAWAGNQALKWTGGGAAPIMRVTQWDSDGSVICDKKVNRPRTIADIDAALSQCIAP